MMGTTSSRNNVREPTLSWRHFRKPAGSWYVILHLHENPLDQLKTNGDRIIRSWPSTMSVSYTGYIANVIRLLNEILVIFMQNKNNVVMSKGYIFSFANTLFHPLRFLKIFCLHSFVVWGSCISAKHWYIHRGLQLCCRTWIDIEATWATSIKQFYRADIFCWETVSFCRAKQSSNSRDANQNKILKK